MAPSLTAARAATVRPPHLYSAGGKAAFSATAGRSGPAVFTIASPGRGAAPPSSAPGLSLATRPSLFTNIQGLSTSRVATTANNDPGSTAAASAPSSAALRGLYSGGPTSSRSLSSRGAKGGGSATPALLPFPAATPTALSTDRLRGSTKGEVSSAALRTLLTLTLRSAFGGGPISGRGVWAARERGILGHASRAGASCPFRPGRIRR